MITEGCYGDRSPNKTGTGLGLIWETSLQASIYSKKISQKLDFNGFSIILNQYRGINSNRHQLRVFNGEDSNMQQGVTAFFFITLFHLLKCRVMILVKEFRNHMTS